ncbi:sucrase ferredoxin [Histidinibacterium lentulum]|uniref:Sucrase ferredoxin n=1 Tax=Histidinibacterium lentulum TaxID=2480588 RepID=A0A3N2R5X1_9RHOB|nr:sucrase ferredoxin [Histidinibacterium lentulum]ROU02797.1 sucrase ferredoxin [Histidinibacterium lentulum]
MAARFCTEHSLAAGEPLAGWGAHQARNVLIRWPKAKWRHSLRIAADMDEATEAAIGRVVEAGWRVNLIDRKGAGTDRIGAFVFPGALAFDLAPDDLPAFLGAVTGGVAALARFRPRPASRPLVLCCTHGKHDRCCAKWGFAVYQALAKSPEAGDFDIWEVTHLGGCRLSAGVLVLPAMRKYGRVCPSDAPALLDTERRGLPYLPCYRGASHLPPPAQVAEVTGLRHLAAEGIRGTALVQETGPALYAVTVRGAVAEIRVEPGETFSYGACTDLHARKPLEPTTVWRGTLAGSTSPGTGRPDASHPDPQSERKTDDPPDPRHPAGAWRRTRRCTGLRARAARLRPCGGRNLHPGRPAAHRVAAR